jgi:hypothetical protein
MRTSLSSGSLREIVKIVLQNHPKDCIFHPDALENIMQELDGNTTCPRIVGRDFYDFDVVGDIERAIKRQEIYCPHEGIDKRKEFGL